MFIYVWHTVTCISGTRYLVCPEVTRIFPKEFARWYLGICAIEREREDRIPETYKGKNADQAMY